MTWQIEESNENDDQDNDEKKDNQENTDAIQYNEQE